MASESSMIKSVRLELGDNQETFRDSFRGTGDKDDYDLPANNVTSLVVFQVAGDEGITTLVEDVDYTVDRARGTVTFATPPEQDALYVAEGQANGIFTDEEIQHFLDGAISQHLKDRQSHKRFRDGNGFIRYEYEPMTLDSLPREEEILVSLLATIEALWALSTDASLDIDVNTPEGTSIPRGQRFRQVTAQIDLLTEKYQTLSLQMGVGLYAPEVMNMRRVSRSTGRLVPVFEEREYDENGPPIRKVPGRSSRDSERDGPASPFWAGGYGF